MLELLARRVQTESCIGLWPGAVLDPVLFRNKRLGRRKFPHWLRQVERRGCNPLDLVGRSASNLVKTHVSRIDVDADVPVDVPLELVDPRDVIRAVELESPQNPVMCDLCSTLE